MEDFAFADQGIGLRPEQKAALLEKIAFEQNRGSQIAAELATRNGAWEPVSMDVLRSPSQTIQTKWEPVSMDFGRQPRRSEAEVKIEGIGAGDVGRVWMSGSANVASTLAEGIKFMADVLGLPGAADTAGAWRDTFQNAEKFWQEDLSKPAKEALAGDLENHPFGTFFLNAVQSAPGVLAMAGPAIVIARGLQASAVATRIAGQLAAKGVPQDIAKAAGVAESARVGGVTGEVVTKALQNLRMGAPRAGKIGAAAPGALGASVSEGVYSALANAAQTAEEVRGLSDQQILEHPFGAETFAAMDQSIPRADRIRQVRNAMANAAETQVLLRTAPWTAIAGMVGGGGILGQITRPSRGLAKGAIKGGWGEFKQEFPQSYGEQVIQNIAAQNFYEQNRDPLADALKQAVIGGGAGALLGGVGGGAHGMLSSAPPGPPNAPGAPPGSPAPPGPPGRPGGPGGPPAGPGPAPPGGGTPSDEQRAAIQRATIEQERQAAESQRLRDAFSGVGPFAAAAGAISTIDQARADAKILKAQGDLPGADETRLDNALLLSSYGEIPAVAKVIENPSQYPSLRDSLLRIAPRFSEEFKKAQVQREQQAIAAQQQEAIESNTRIDKLTSELAKLKAKEQERIAAAKEEKAQKIAKAEEEKRLQEAAQTAETARLIGVARAQSLAEKAKKLAVGKIGAAGEALQMARRLGETQKEFKARIAASQGKINRGSIMAAELRKITGTANAQAAEAIPSQAQGAQEPAAAAVGPGWKLGTVEREGEPNVNRIVATQTIHTYDHDSGIYKLSVYSKGGKPAGIELLTKQSIGGMRPSWEPARNQPKANDMAGAMNEINRRVEFIKKKEAERGGPQIAPGQAQPAAPAQGIAEVAPAKPGAPEPVEISEAEKNRRVKLSQQAAERKKINIDQDSIIQAIIKLGGINLSERQDIIGDTKGNRGILGVGYLFSKRGFGSDDMATRLGQRDYSYMSAAELADSDGGVAALKEKIRQEFSGERTHWSAGSEAQFRRQAEAQNQIEAERAKVAETAAKEMGAELEFTVSEEELAAEGIQTDGQSLAIAELVDRAEAIKPGIAEDLAMQHDTDDAYMAALVQFLKENENAAIREPAQDHPMGEGAARPAVAEAQEVGRRPEERPDLALEGQSPEDLLRAKQLEAAQAQIEAARAQKEAADAQIASFGLTGSNRQADVGAAAGQQSLLEQNRQPPYTVNYEVRETERGPEAGGREAAEGAIDLFPTTPIQGSQVQAFEEKIVVSAEKVGTHKVAFNKIDTAAQAAATFQDLNKSPREGFWMLGLDAKNKPIAFYKLFSGTLAQTSVYPREVWTALYQTTGVRSVWIAHQHPSGIAQPSQADQRLTSQLGSVLTPDIGIILRGHLIITKNATIDLGPKAEFESKVTVEQGEPKYSLPIIERTITKQDEVGASVDSPAAVREFFRQFNPQETGLLVLDAQHRPTGWWPMSLAAMSHLRTSDINTGMAALMRAVGRGNPAAAIAYSPQPAGSQFDYAVKNIGSALNLADVNMLDAIVNEQNGAMSSFAERGLALKGYGDTFYFRGQPTGPVHTEASFRAALSDALDTRQKGLGAALLGLPQVRIITRDQVPANMGNPDAYVTPDGRVHFVADRIPQNWTVDQLVGLATHEIAVHAVQMNREAAEWQAILKTMRILREAGNKAVRAAYAKAEQAGASERLMDEETLGYLVQDNPNLSVVKRAIAWIRQAIRDLGKTLPRLQRTALFQWANNLNVGDLQAMAADALIAAPQRGQQALTEGARLAVAYHGTPHVWAPEQGFPHGRPRLDKIGTGEGAQAYGWGWYSAETEGTGDAYRKALEGANYAYIGDKQVKGDTALSLAIQAKHSSQDPFSFLKRMEGNNPWMAEKIEAARKALPKAMATQNTRYGQTGGSLYRLDIPDDVLPNLLDWDRPLSEQSEKVRAALTASLPAKLRDAFPEGIKKASDWLPWLRGNMDTWRGEDVYRALSSGKGQNAEAASHYLASIGIPGNRYLDQGSRAPQNPFFHTREEAALWKGMQPNGYKMETIELPNGLFMVKNAERDLTYNYVIWDQPTLDRIALLERNGEKLDAMREASVEQPRASYSITSIATSPKISRFAGALLRSPSALTIFNTFNTQYHKAETLAAKGFPQFKAVFEKMQEYLNDIASFATSAEQRAPAIFREIRGIGLKSLRTYFGGAASDADIAAIGPWLNAGTLYGGPSPLDGIIWTDDELRGIQSNAAGARLLPRGIPRLTETQIPLYHQARDALAQTIEDGAKAVMYRHVKRYGVNFEKTDSLDQVAETVRDQLSERRNALQIMEQHATNVADEAFRIAEEAKQNARAQPRNRALAMIAESRQAESVRAQKDLDAILADIAKLNVLLDHPGKDENGNSITIKGTISNIEDRAYALIEHGYMPLKRFGHLTVAARDANGWRFFGAYDGKPLVPGSARIEANEVATAIRHLHPEWAVTIGTRDESSWKMYQGLSLDALENFLDLLDPETRAEIERDKVIQEYLIKSVNNRSVMKELIHRKGTPGFSTDVPRILASFITGHARNSSGLYHIADAKSLVEDIPQEQGDIRGEAADLIKYVVEPGEEAAKLRGFLFFHFLGNSVAAAAVNLSQTVMMTVPHLSQYTTAGRLVASILSAAKRAVLDPTSIQGDIGAALQRAESSGVTAPQQIHHLTATAANNPFSSNRSFRSFMAIWGGMFSAAEVFNRRVAFMAAFDIATGNGMNSDQAYDFAKKTVDETQLIYNKGNRPNISRGALGATVMTFKMFSLGYLELLKRLPPKQQLMMLGILLLVSGAEGLPFEEDIADLVDTLGQWLGFSTNTGKWTGKVVRETLGKDFERPLLKGLGGMLPFDLHSRLGMPNLLPGTAFFKPSEIDKTRDVAQAVGPIGSVLQAFSDSLQMLARGRWDSAALNVQPKAIRDLVNGLQMAARGESTDIKGRLAMKDVTKTEAFAKALGFNPQRAAIEGEVKREEMLSRNLRTVRMDDIASDWADAILRKDTEKAKRARDTFIQWNKDNPEMGINGQSMMRSVIERVRAGMRTSAERFIKSTPRPMKKEVTEALRP